MSFEFKQVKLYQIDKHFYEFRGLDTPEQKIEVIIDFHKNNFESSYHVFHDISEKEINGIKHVIYTFKEQEKVSSWKHFLPNELTANHDFNILSTSFALFCILHDEIYALVGGKGISVIKKYYNPTFGIELLSRICDPNNDVVHSLVARSILGRLTSEQKTYRNEQKLADALSIGTVPKNISISLRDNLKKSTFSFIEFEESENVILSASSSFHIKKSIAFEDAINLLKHMHHIYVNESGLSLSRFEKIVDKGFCENELLSALLTHLRDDASNLYFGHYNEFNSLDQDFAHPDKFIPFLEAERYEAYYKGATTPFYTNTSRFNLYQDILEKVYSELPSDHSQVDFNIELLGVRIKSFKGEHKQTEAMFINHVSCELSFMDKPYFLIDNIWYKIKGDFINTINDECLAYLINNKWNSNFLNETWNLNNESEGQYNLKYNDKQNTLVLDKVLSQEIELCDILHFTENELFLIHVKKGFDAKMRDLTNQIMIASARLWNDNKSNQEFLIELYSNFTNSSSFNINPLSQEEFLNLFTRKITFVLAFCNTKRNIACVADDIRAFRSNIAKFSLIQHVKEMNSYEYHEIKIAEIPKV